MEIKDNDYIVGMWFAEAKNGDNWQLTLLKRDNKWLGEYRFRYKVDEKVFDSKDKKSFYSFTIDGKMKEKEVIAKLNKLFELIKIKYPKGKFVEVKGDMDKFMYVMAQEKFIHIKFEKRGEK